MKICIYCKTKNQSLFKGVEHLIPQSFGTFGTDTPTLDCVCDTCNNFFGRTIDQSFARDSWEGVTRYKQGIVSSEKRGQKRLSFKIGDEKEMGGFAGAKMDGIDSQTGRMMQIPTQFQILNKKTNEYEIFLKDDVKNIKLDDDTYGIPGTRKTKLFASSRVEYDSLIEDLKKIGIDESKNEIFYPPFIEDKNDEDIVSLPIDVQGTIDSVIKRAIVKILLNFTAKYVGVEEVLKTEWDKSRNYVRLESEPIFGRLSEKPFWGEETETMRFVGDSFNILVENQDKNVIGKLQAYNFYTYEFILAENHNIPSELETAARFTKDKAPCFAQKRTI